MIDNRPQDFDRFFRELARQQAISQAKAEMLERLRVREACKTLVRLRVAR